MSFSKRLPIKVIQKAQEGDKFAITQIYHEYKSAILGLSYRILQDSCAAEDILQQVIVKMMNKVSNLNDPAKFNGWLKTLTYRASIDHINKHKKEIGLESMDELSSYETDTLGETNLDLEKYLINLNERERLVIILFLVEGATHKEVAEQLEISEVNSKQIYRRAMNKLKQLVTKTSYSGVMNG
ncbi:MAG: sigma-70 family RNA polymerase sigma factor [Gammaproteobacteria bacterium]|nr:sigma-70 family RNA polymerase sigma factor [Gammaproteobacteria bacterium]